MAGVSIEGTKVSKIKTLSEGTGIPRKCIRAAF